MAPQQDDVDGQNGEASANMQTKTCMALPACSECSSQKWKTCPPTRMAMGWQQQKTTYISVTSSPGHRKNLHHCQNNLINGVMCIVNFRLAQHYHDALIRFFAMPQDSLLFMGLCKKYAVYMTTFCPTLITFFMEVSKIMLISQKQDMLKNVQDVYTCHTVKMYLIHT